MGDVLGEISFDNDFLVTFFGDSLTSTSIGDLTFPPVFILRAGNFFFVLLATFGDSNSGNDSFGFNLVGLAFVGTDLALLIIGDVDLSGVGERDLAALLDRLGLGEPILADFSGVGWVDLDLLGVSDIDFSGVG